MHLIKRDARQGYFNLYSCLETITRRNDKKTKLMTAICFRAFHCKEWRNERKFILKNQNVKETKIHKAVWVISVTLSASLFSLETILFLVSFTWVVHHRLPLSQVSHSPHGLTVQIWGLFAYSDIYYFICKSVSENLVGMSEEALRLVERGKSGAAVRGAGQWSIDMAVCWPQQIPSRYRNLSDTCQVNRAACRCQPGPSSLLPPSHVVRISTQWRKITFS